MSEHHEKIGWLKRLGVQVLPQAPDVGAPGGGAPGGGAPGGEAEVPEMEARIYEPPPLPVAALAPEQKVGAPVLGLLPPGPAERPKVTPYDPATAGAPAPARPKPDPSVSELAPAAAKTPMENRADLERRLAAAQPVYDQYGKAIGDDAFKLADQLSPAEQKIGKVISEGGGKVVVTSAQGTTTNQVALEGDGSRSTLDERGYTISNKRSVGTADIGSDGKVAEKSVEYGVSQNIGMGNYTETASTKRIDSEGGTTTTRVEQASTSVDLLKGDVTVGRSASVETRTPQTTVKSAESLTGTFGVSGASVTQERTETTGKKFETQSESFGMARGAGTLGLSSSKTEKGGTKAGPEEAEYTVKGGETTTKRTGGLVSDAGGTGLSGNSVTSGRKNFENGASLAGNYSAGGKLQSVVKEIPNSNPPKFKITTTISFDLGAGGSAGAENPRAKPLDASKGADAKIGGEDNKKGAVSVGVSASVGKSASFSHIMSDEEAADYIAAIKDNGRGSKLPEHRILASGLKDGWDKAAELWAEISGDHSTILDAAEGTEIERTTKGSAGVRGSASIGDRNPVGPSLGIEAGGGVTGTVTIKLAKQAKGIVKVTASVDGTVDSSFGVSGGMQGVSAGHKETHSDGAGEEVVFLLDGNNRELFEAQLDEIDGCYSRDALLKLSKKPGFNVQETTEKESHSDGDANTVGIGKINVGMTGASALSAETKRDAEGNVISSKVTASNEVGGSIGTEDIKLAASVAEGFAAEVTGGKAKAELSQTTKGSDLGKTLDNIVAAASDPLGAVLNPGKLVGATADVKAIDLNDEEMTALASRALDKTKWDSQVGGRRRDEWVVAGDKIRAAITEKDGVVVGVNKTVVNRAIAEWTKGSDGDRVGVLRQMMRPEGGKGAPSGKDVAFPDGTEKYKPVWDGLMTVDVLAGPKALMATDPKGALDQLQEVNGKLNDLRFAMKDMEGKWAGAEGQFAEMMGHIVGRVHDCDQAILEAKKAMKGAGKKGKSKPASAGVEKVMQAFAEDEAQAERDPVDLQAYRENLEQMQVYFDAVFGLIKEAQAKSQEKGIFSGAGIEEAKAAGELLRSARERLGQWKPLYDKTYKLWEALSPRHELDKAAMEKLHPHGAQEFYDQVHKDVTK